MSACCVIEVTDAGSWFFGLPVAAYDSALSDMLAGCVHLVCLEGVWLQESTASVYAASARILIWAVAGLLLPSCLVCG
jgi:hypothetical protein